MSKLIILCLIGLSLNSHANLVCSDVISLSKQSDKIQQQEFKANQKLLNFNWFPTSRDIYDYDQEFSEKVHNSQEQSSTIWSFLQKVKSLNSSHRWLDSGAGAAGAMKSYLKMLGSNSLQIPELVALAFKRPLSTFFSKLGSIIYLSGRKIEEIPDHQLGTYDLITDFYGPVAYSENPFKVVNKYLRLVRENGVILLKLDFINTVIDSQTGKAKSLAEWLKSELQLDPSIEVKLIHHSVLRITVKQVSNFQIRELPIIFFKSGPPPTRSFQD